MTIKANREKKSEKAIGALRAIRDAASETLKYEAWREAHPNERMKEREMEISSKWYGVSYLVRPYSQELAKRLNYKGNYWETPERWSQLEISDAGIGLKRVVEEADRLLTAWITPA
jgi:hypothetical protein